ncbi:MAG TPA: zinc-ribbon domain-containing protein, partial [Mycobacteriales bacterium]|nr:zinc-ribbon domain-containing protein [Mycobacteriales bacterium]
GSNAKAWWRCSAEHEWQAVIASRNSGRGCPICSGRTAADGTSLADLSPILAAQWHPTRNGGLTPTQVRPGSDGRVWWECAQGHEWQAAISSRSGGRGCPICRSQGWSQVAFQIGAELATLLPLGDLETAPQTVRRDLGWEPDIVLSGHQIAVDIDGRHWHNDAHYPGSLARDTRKKRAFEEADWALVRVREAPLERLGPDDLVVSDLSDTKGTVVALAHHLQVQFGLSVPKLAKYQATDGLAAESVADALIAKFQTARLVGRSLGDMYPNLLAEWHESLNGALDPASLYSHSERLAWWRCTHGHEWQAVVARRADGDGCPYCSGKWIGYGNSLADLNPELAAQWHPTRNEDLHPSDVRPGSGTKVWWLCANGHEWHAQINSRNRGSGCPSCRIRRVEPGVTLADWNPQLAAEWHPTRNGDLTPSDVRPKSSKKAWWQCSAGHEWETLISGRSNGLGCPYCSGKRAGYGNSLADLDPLLSAEWHPTRNGDLTPSDVRPKSNKRVWWLCARGHEWEAIIESRSSGRGCPRCAGREARS